MKRTLVSMLSCGESLEKALAIFYLAKISNPSFYSMYNINIFYGHNLPKKDMNVNVHGTIGFYSEYLSDLKFIPYCTKKYLLNQNRYIIEKLILHGYLSYRVGEKLIDDKVRYWRYIKELPFEYIYPDFIRNLVHNSCSMLDINKLQQIYLEKNYISLINNIKSNIQCYSIYALDSNGNIGRFYLQQPHQKALIHLYSDLSKMSVLSGNSAVLLATIQKMIGSSFIVGYRQHRREKRLNRDVALEQIIQNCDTLIEPSNYLLNKYFDAEEISSCSELRVNKVYAKVYRDYLINNMYSLNL